MLMGPRRGSRDGAFNEELVDGILRRELADGILSFVDGILGEGQIS